MRPPRQVNHDGIDTDYLIVGSGAVGMAVADVLFHETGATITVVDRRHGPGGHWNDAYPFIRLHQPSAYYGVNSMELGSDTRDTTPLNLGMCERATAAEILAYYDELMRGFVASERFTHLPMCEYDGDFRSSHHIASLLTGSDWEVRVRRKVVDTTYLATQVPATRRPNFAVSPGVQMVPPGGLARTGGPPGRFVVIGSGKTAIDACLWLLENGVDPDRVVWVRPRDPWLQNRANVQPGDAFFEQAFTAMAVQAEIAAAARSIEDLFRQLEAAGLLLRIDPSVEPRMYHGATASTAEVEALRAISAVVRMGRVRRIELDRLVLELGEVPAGPDWLYVDCTARGVAIRPPIPVFAGPAITPQMVRVLQPVFGAALIAHIEAVVPEEDEKNLLCVPIPMTDTPRSWLEALVVNLANQSRWRSDPRLRDWIVQSRLDRFSALARSVPKTDSARLALLHRYGEAAPAAGPNLQRLLGL